jgi:hypothetical protein
VEPGTIGRERPLPVRGPALGPAEERGAEAVHPDPVVELLLRGEARTAYEAEELYLDTHLEDVLRLVESELPEPALRRHPLIALLLSHGSRPREDSLR